MRTAALFIAGTAAVVGWAYLATGGLAVGLLLLLGGALALLAWWRLPEPAEPVPLEPMRHRATSGVDAYGPFIRCECGDHFETPEQHAVHLATLES